MRVSVLPTLTHAAVVQLVPGWSECWRRARTLWWTATPFLAWPFPSPRCVCVWARALAASVSQPSPSVFCARLPPQGLDLERCKDPDRGLPAPDAVLFLHMGIDAAAERGDFGAERYEKRDMQQRVAAAFERLREPSWVMVNAGRSVEDVGADVERAAFACIERARERPPGRLWPRDSAAHASAGDALPPPRV